MTMYPLPIRFPASYAHVDIVVAPKGWSFASEADADNFGQHRACPRGQRAHLRRLLNVPKCSTRGVVEHGSTSTMEDMNTNTKPAAAAHVVKRTALRAYPGWET
jgi:hypothetical protein